VHDAGYQSFRRTNVRYPRLGQVLCDLPFHVQHRTLAVRAHDVEEAVSWPLQNEAEVSKGVLGMLGGWLPMIFTLIHGSD
jgi:hypothetical protein